jgi:RNA polymerase sigma factor for flagellar operon FliA
MNTLEKILQKNNLEEAHKLLTQRERKIISLYYLEGYKDEEIAAFYEVTQQAINYIRKKGIKKLKIF